MLLELVNFTLLFLDKFHQFFLVLVAITCQSGLLEVLVHLLLQVVLHLLDFLERGSFSEGILDVFQLFFELHLELLVLLGTVVVVEESIIYAVDGSAGGFRVHDCLQLFELFARATAFKRSSEAVMAPACFPLGVAQISDASLLCCDF